MVSLVLSEACKQKYSSAAVRVVRDYLQKISLKWYVERERQRYRIYECANVQKREND